MGTAVTCMIDSQQVPLKTNVATMTYAWSSQGYVIESGDWDGDAEILMGLLP